MIWFCLFSGGESRLPAGETGRLRVGIRSSLTVIFDPKYVFKIRFCWYQFCCRGVDELSVSLSLFFQCVCSRTLTHSTACLIIERTVDGRLYA